MNKLWSQAPQLLTTVSDSITIVRFNRPAERNPLSIATLQELKLILSSLVSRTDIKAVIFTGADDVFLAGADIRELARLDSNTAVGFAKLGQSLFQTIADARYTTIAAINGYCMGGGLDLALACDIRVASETAVFGHPGAKLGIITGWGGTQRLPRIIGRARALEFFAAAHQCSGAAALEIGLISRVADPVMECALECAQAAVEAASPS